MTLQRSELFKASARVAPACTDGNSQWGPSRPFMFPGRTWQNRVSRAHCQQRPPTCCEESTLYSLLRKEPLFAGRCACNPGRFVDNGATCSQARLQNYPASSPLESKACSYLFWNDVLVMETIEMYLAWLSDLGKQLIVTVNVKKTRQPMWIYDGCMLHCCLGTAIAWRTLLRQALFQPEGTHPNHPLTSTTP